MAADLIGHNTDCIQIVIVDKMQLTMKMAGATGLEPATTGKFVLSFFGSSAESVGKFCGFELRIN